MFAPDNRASEFLVCAMNYAPHTWCYVVHVDEFLYFLLDLLHDLNYIINICTVANHTVVGYSNLTVAKNPSRHPQDGLAT